MSHERSITIQDENTGKWVNIATVYKGKPVTEEKATALYNNGFLQPLGRKDYKKVETADYMAGKRSTQAREGEAFGKARPPGARR